MGGVQGVATVAGGRVVQGCFGIGIIAGLAHFSYKSKNFCAEGKQPPLLLAEPPLTIDADHADKEQVGAPDGMGTRNVVVSVGDCGFHGETVAEAPVWGQYVRVRVLSCAWGEVPAEAGMTHAGGPSTGSGRTDAPRASVFLPPQE